jgi:hypothetical protein
MRQYSHRGTWEKSASVDASKDEEVVVIQQKCKW